MAELSTNWTLTDYFCCFIAAIVTLLMIGGPSVSSLPISKEHKESYNNTFEPELVLGHKERPWTSKLTREQFLELSRQSFNALDGSIYHGSPIDHGESKFESNISNEKVLKPQSYWKDLDSDEEPFYKHKVSSANDAKSNQRSRKSRRRGRKGKRARYPNRKQAFEIANQELLREKETCKTAMMKQRIRAEGCLTKIVVNRYCFGQCRSLFIPKVRRRKLKAAFQSCSACVPIDYAPVVVTLKCPARPTKILRRTVMKVKKCACKSVEL